tara:strand:+ start:454 stop:1617 length:1164 start_codon:yes stop_codon:yes gene_type:complete
MKKLLFKINAERVLLFALVYYGLSIYFDIFFYDITTIPIFLNSQSNYFPSSIYFYTWTVPIFSIVVYLFLSKIFSNTLDNNYLEKKNDNMNLIVPFGYMLYFFILLIIMPNADNRAAVLLEINENYSLVSWLLPITIWCSCFSILFAKNKSGIFFAFFLVMLFSLTLVDRSYLLMGVLSLLFRIERLNFLILVFLAIIGFFVVTFWKVVLFWLVFNVDLNASLQNIQPGLARFEAITSQSIFVNCIEFEQCKEIELSVFLESTFGRIMPSFIYQSEIDTTQVRYINEFFPEIAQRGGGLGFSLPAEFLLAFGRISGPWIMTIYIIFLLVILKFSRSPIVNFIFAVYFLRFLRVDFATGIKGIFVFGFVSLVIYNTLSILTNLRKVRI